MGRPAGRIPPKLLGGAHCVGGEDLSLRCERPDVLMMRRSEENSSETTEEFHTESRYLILYSPLLQFPECWAMVQPRCIPVPLAVALLIRMQRRKNTLKNRLPI